MGGGKYVLRDGEQVDTSFSHLLFYGLPRSRTLRRKTDIRYVTNPTPAPAAPAPPADPPAPDPPAPAPAPAPEATPPAEPEPLAAPEATPSAESASAPAPAPEATPDPTSEFTAADDEAILKLKSENKTWAQIGEVVKGKDKSELRERYKELMAKNGGSLAPAAASPNSDAGGAAAGGADAAGGKKEKGKGGKGKQKGVAVGVKEQGKKMEEGEGAALQAEAKLPIIYFDEDDGLDLDDLQMAYDLYVQYEGRKWNLIASKLFDKTGKRIDPDVLKGKFVDAKAI